MKSSFLNSEKKQLFQDIHQEWDSCFFSIGEEGEYREALMDLQRQLFHHGNIATIREQWLNLKKSMEGNDQ